MQRALGLGLALAIAVRAPAVRADPGAPQVGPAHAQREDAQLLEDQQRGLDRDPPAPASPPGPAGRASAPEASVAPTTVVTDHRMVAVGVVLLGAAAVSGVTALTLAPLDTPLAGDSQGTYDTWLKVFAATAAISGVTGIILLASSRSRVQVAPAVTPRSIGLAIMGQI